MKNFWLLLASFFCFGSSLSSQQWSQLNSVQNLTNNTLKGCYFVDDNTGWMVGEIGLIIKTTNGGNNWTPSYLVQSGFNSVWFTSSTRGFVAGEIGYIYKTTDAGNNWTFVNHQQTQNTLNKLFFLKSNPNYGWACGEGGEVLRTTNGGDNWSSSFPTSNNIQSIYFVNQTTGWIVVAGGQVWKSTNGGADWSFQSGLNAQNSLNGVFFLDLNNGYVVGDIGAIYKTTNGGNNWTELQRLTYNSFRDCYFSSVSTGWVVGELGNIFYTSNGGTTWEPQLVNPNINSFYSVNFSGGNIGWVCGVLGYAYKYNSNSTTITINSPSAGVSWVAGTAQTISWTSSGINFIKIEYSTNNGSSYSTIAASYSASQGSYSWSIPNTPSNQCKIKISDVNNPGVFSTSELFSIISSSTKFIGVIAPNGGEVFNTGETRQIQWSSNAVTSVYIDLSTNGGTSYTPITNDPVSSSGSYDWTVPSSPSNNCLIKVRDASNSSVYDVSNSIFSIRNSTNSSYILLNSPNGGERIGAGDVFRIDWNTNVAGNVVIELSTNNGTTWTTVISSTPAQYISGLGYYDWTVPANYSNNAKIRVTSIANSSVKDESNNVFQIINGTSKYITNVKSGLNEYEPGQLLYLGWDSYNVERVKIEFSSDNGTNWKVINTDTSNAQHYNWRVPYLNANYCKFKVSVAGDPSVSGIQINTFKIKIKNPSLYLTKPNGGERLLPYTKYDIIYDSYSNDFVKIQYTTNNGNAWIDIIQNYIGTADRFSWTVPFAPSSQCKVKVMNSSQNNINAESENVFTISNKYIKCFWPNGGENLGVGQQINIVWQSSGINFFKIQYSTNNGSNWINIYDEIYAPDNTAVWTVPNTPSNQCLIKIIDKYEEGIFHITPATFRIYQPSIRIKAPNGGENWKVGTVQNITWSQKDVSAKRLEFTTNNGSSWNSIARHIPSGDSSYSWIVPDTITPSCKVRIYEITNPSVGDMSDNNFSIFKPSVRVVFPNGEENLRTGKQCNITWTSSFTTKVKISFTTDGISWNTIAPSINASAGVYVWNIPVNIVSSLCKIQVTDTSDSSNNDLSDNYFTIFNEWIPVKTNFTNNYNSCYFLDKSIGWVAGSGGKIIKTTDGGLNWSDYSIAMAKSIFDVKFVSSFSGWVVGQAGMIYFSKDGGTGWTKQNSNTSVNLYSCFFHNYTTGFIAGGQGLLLSTTDGGNNWTTVSLGLITNDLYHIYFVNANTGWICGSGGKILKTTDGGASWTSKTSGTSASLTSVNFVDESVGYAVGNNGLTIKTTNGGNNWFTQTSGQSVNLMSNSPVTDSLGFAVGSSGTIIKTTNGGNVWSKDTISATAKLNHIQMLSQFAGWTVGDSATILKYSPNVYLTLLYPDGGEGFSGGAQVNIRWLSNNVNNIKIEFSTNSGQAFNTVAASVQASSGSYLWTAPSITNFNCRIKITDISNSKVWDISAKDFTIKTLLPSISLISPNGGEVWTAGKIKNITWNYQVVQNVKLEYTTNNGATWLSIVNSTPAEPKSFAWTVPETPSNQCRVKISDVSNPARKDSSSNVFTVFQSPLVLTAPDGGEKWLTRYSNTVKWIAGGSVANVKLEYTTNNGTNWTIITSSIPANQGVYVWNTNLNINSALCKVRVSDAANSAVKDTSDNTFSLNTPVIIVQTPNGGEVYRVNSNQFITWNSEYIEKLQIELTTDNGSTWINIARDIDSTQKSYSWVVPYTPSVNCRIKLTDMNNSLIKDSSNQKFSIQYAEWVDVLDNSTSDLFSIYFPSSGNGWVVGDTSFYTTNAGNEWYGKDISPTVLNSVSFVSESVGFAVSGAYTRVFKTTNGGVAWNLVYSQSLLYASLKSVFFIDEQTGWVVGDGYDNGGHYGARAMKTTDGGTTWTTPIQNTAGNFYGVFFMNSSLGWIVGTSGILKTTNGGTNWSNQNNSATFLSCYFRNSNLGWATGVNGVYKTTNGGANWIRKSTISDVRSVHFITDNNGYFCGDFGIIQYTTDGGETWTETQSGTRNHLYSVFAAADNNVWACGSNGTLIKHSKSSAIFVKSPNGGEVFSSFDNCIISWNAVNVQNLKIQFSADSGATWTTIVNSIPSANGSYNWTIPQNINSTKCLIRISNELETSNDVSNRVFTITSPEITINSPDGGEAFLVGNQYNISFTTVAVPKINIQYSTNNGISWLRIDTAVSTSTGVYQWTIPNTQSNYCKVKLISYSNPNITDVSNAEFRIYKPGLKLTAPNGGENYSPGSQISITWISNDVNRVRIEMTSNNGTSWSLLSNSYPANLSNYGFKAPNNPSNQCKIRIADSSNVNLADTSDYLFTINFLPSDWIVQQNSITSRKFNSVSFATSLVGYAAGENGTIYKTTNSGISWNSQTSGTSRELSSIFFINEQTGWAAGDYGVILKTTDGGINWIGKNFSTYSNSSVYFKTANKGWMTGYLGYFYRSADGGNNWNYTSNLQSSWLFSIYFFNESKGWACGTLNNNGQIFKSTDGGATWAMKYNAGNDTLFSIHFTTENEGWAVGANGKILKSTNGGDNWFEVTSNTTERLKNVVFSSYTTGWIVGSTGYILKTTDAGLNWNRENSNTFRNLSSVSFPRTTTGWAVGDSGMVLNYTANKLQLVAPNNNEQWKAGSSQNISWISQNVSDVKLLYSTNAGLTWKQIIGSTPAGTGNYTWVIPNTPSSSCLVKVCDAADTTRSDVGNNNFSILRTLWAGIPTSFSSNMYAVHFFNSQYGWATGDTGKIARTTDGGNTWSQQFYYYNQKWNSVHFPTQTTGWCAGLTGYIIKTTNGGSSWANQVSGVTTNLNSVYFVDNTYGWMVGDNGVALRTQSGGSFWNKYSTGSADNLYSVKFIDVNTGWAVGGTVSGRIIKSVNSGVSWTDQTCPVNSVLRAVTFLNSNIGYAAGDSGYVIKTTNGGTNWFVVSKPTTKNLLCINFLSQSEGFTGGKDGIIYYTEDGGNTWSLQSSNSPTDVNGLFFFSSNNGWAAVNDGKLLKNSEVSNVVLSINAPNAGTVWQAGTNQNITWGSDGINQLKISYSTNNGLNWSTVVNSVMAVNGAYQWAVPSTPSVNCRIKLSDANDSVYYVVSEKFTISSILTRGVQVAGGWNLVSVPLKAASMLKNDLFPSSLSQAFEYNNGYLNADTLKSSKGYWLKFGQQENINISGVAASPNTQIPVIQGWNMIGPFERNVPVSSVTSNPGGIISSAFFGYNAGYSNADTLFFGKGYWVKTSQNGVLNLPPTALAKGVDDFVFERINKESLTKDYEGKITVQDESGNSKSLFLIKQGIDFSSLELPPAPPPGIFDIRFSDNFDITDIRKPANAICISSASYPVRIRTEKLRIRLEDLAGGKIINKTLRPGEEFVLSNPELNRLGITIIEIPKDFALQQNYPNPFNPATMIKYQLPEDCRVTLKVFNPIGQEVFKVVDKEQEAGYYSVLFEPKMLASGFYIYELRAGNFRSVKKMMFIK